MPHKNYGKHRITHNYRYLVFFFFAECDIYLNIALKETKKDQELYDFQSLCCTSVHFLERGGQSLSMVQE